MLSLAFCLVKAAPAAEEPAFSPDKKHQVTQAGGNVTVKDARGKTLFQFVPQDSSGPHIGIMEIYLVDNERLGIRLHMNPSLDYLSITDLSGRELQHYLGYAFFWSHDRSAVAHVGQMIHFADWPHSEYIQVNDRTVYPTAGPAYGKEAKTVHTFTPPFCWSPDDGNLAVIDEVEGQDQGKYLIIIPTKDQATDARNATNQARRFKIPIQQSAPIASIFPEGVKLTWQGKTAVKIASANNYKGYGLPCTISLK